MCSRSWDLWMIIGQLETSAHTVCRTFHSNRVRFDGLVRTRSGYKNTIIRKDFLPTGYRIGGRCFLVTFLGSAEGGGDVIYIRRWNVQLIYFFRNSVLARIITLFLINRFIHHLRRISFFVFFLYIRNILIFSHKIVW